MAKLPGDIRGKLNIMKFSVIIPAHNEERLIGKCLESVAGSASAFRGDVEVIVVVNRCTDRTEQIALIHGARVVKDGSRNLAAIRNAGAAAARGNILVTIDADSTMSLNMLPEIDRALATGRYIGGGVPIHPERWSAGIVATYIVGIPFVLRYRISAGLFWCYRSDFEALGGFDTNRVSCEDVDFAVRLKALGKGRGKRFKTLWGTRIVTSCRKWDGFGDWYFVLHPRFVWRIFRGRDQKAADRLYYDFER